MDELAREQLASLRHVGVLLDEARIDHWLFGGWAVDFYAGSITRPHSDVDLAVWLDDVPRIAELLEAEGWRHAPHDDEDGGTGYERGGVRVELTYLVRDGDACICIPFRTGPTQWGEGLLGNDVGDLHGVRARLIRRAGV
jgi:Aminoglycoside-2''-adenylyltransferase